jgi:death-on-curing protein
MTLAGNGFRLQARDMEIADMIIGAAGADAGYEAIADWVRPRIVVGIVGAADPTAG